jgi:hypothetical protein
VRIASFFGLMEATTAATPYAGPTIIDMWLSAAEGDASGLRYGSFIGDLFFSKLFVWGQAAVAGALVGAWLGFHATAGFLALATAILGAVGGGNLLLILLDMSEPVQPETATVRARRRIRCRQMSSRRHIPIAVLATELNDHLSDIGEKTSSGT